MAGLDRSIALYIYNTLLYLMGRAGSYHIDTNVADCLRFFSLLEHKATLLRSILWRLRWGRGDW